MDRRREPRHLRRSTRGRTIRHLPCGDGHLVGASARNPLPAARALSGRSSPPLATGSPGAAAERSPSSSRSTTCTRSGVERRTIPRIVTVDDVHPVLTKTDRDVPTCPRSPRTPTKRAPVFHDAHLEDLRNGSLVILLFGASTVTVS